MERPSKLELGLADRAARGITKSGFKQISLLEPGYTGSSSDNDTEEKEAHTPHTMEILALAGVKMYCDVYGHVTSPSIITKSVWACGREDTCINLPPSSSLMPGTR